MIVSPKDFFISIKSAFPLKFPCKNFTFLIPFMVLAASFPTEYNVSALTNSESLFKIFIAKGFLVIIAESFSSNNSP